MTTRQHASHEAVAQQFLVPVERERRVEAALEQDLVAAEGDWQAVTGSLNPGDQVVTDGADRLRNGSVVSVVGRKKP